jgi:hypothetical protein
MSTRRLLVAVVAVAALAPAGCSDDGPGKGEARLEVDGRAIVERRDGEQDEVRGGTDLHEGDRVELTEGVGRMVLHGGTRMELRAGLGDAADSMVVMGSTPELEAGDLLVSAPDEIEVVAAGTSLRIEEGAARVSRALGVGVGAYDADVHLDSAGQEREVPGLREMQVPALGRPPHDPRPLTYEAEDPWDRRFLGEAMELGARLEAIADAYTTNLNPGEGRTPGFFRLVLPGLEDEPSLDELVRKVERPPGETLVGAAITELGRRGVFADRWTSVFDFRDQGAAWGLVALDQEVSGTPLLGTIEEAIGSSPLVFVGTDVALGPTSPTTVPPGSPGATGSPGSPTTTPPSSPTTTVPTSPTTTPTTPTVPQDPITPTLEPVLDPVVEPVTDLVNGLVGGLLGILGS